MPKDITPAPDELLPIWRDIAYLCHDLFVLWSKSQAILDLHRIEIGDPEYNAVWYLLPITTVIANFFTRRADGEQTAQGPDVGQRLGEIIN